MSKLFWTKEEWDQLRAEAVRLLLETPYLRKEQVLERAQGVLLEGRRRKVTYSAVHRYKGFVDECRALAKQQPKAPPPPAELPVAPTEPIVAALEVLLERLADKIADRLAARLALPVQTTTHAATRHNPEPTSDAALPPRPTVLIVGLLGAQCHQIKNSFSHRLEITCLTSEEAISRPALHKEHTVLMTKFMGHPAQTKYRKHPNMRLCNGGVSELATILKEIA